MSAVARAVQYGDPGQRCPHSLKPASPCSQCLGAPVRKITLDGSQILIDGEPTGRRLDDERNWTADYKRRK